MTAPADIAADTPLVSSGLLDSVGLVRLAALLEQRLGIRIPDADVTPEHFDTLDRIRSYATRRR
jgi:acyl carrier protein